jgi:hypothetical protein
MTGSIDLVPYIAGAYWLGVLVPAGFAVTAWLRLRLAQRRLAALDSKGVIKRARA